MSRLDKGVLCWDEVVTAEFIQRRVRSVFERANVMINELTPELFVVDVPLGNGPDVRLIQTTIFMPPRKARVPVDVLIKHAILDLVDYMYNAGGKDDE